VGRPLPFLRRPRAGVLLPRLEARWLRAMTLLWSATLTQLTARAGDLLPHMEAPAGGMDGVAAPVEDVRPWFHVGGGRRHRGKVVGSELLALWIWEDLPLDLAGSCFNCLLPADHIVINCTRKAVTCPKGRAPAGDGRQLPEAHGLV
jgi:hypothetical protein